MNFPSLGLRKITAYQSEHFGLENFTSVFSKIGGNFSFLKNVEFLEFFGFTLCFRTFQAKNFFSKFF